MRLTFGGWGGAGVIVTEGDKSLTPGGNPEDGRPRELLWGGWGTDRLAARLPRDDPDSGGACILDLGGGGC